MSEKKDKKMPATSKKQDIKIKKDPTAEVLKKVPDEALARAIHDVLLRGKE